MSYRTPTTWRLEQLTVGQVIYCPPHEEVNPKTQRGTGRLQKFVVTAFEYGAAVIQPYHGDAAAEMPLEDRGHG